MSDIPLNKINLAKTDYQGGKSTLCTGCGHDMISTHIINSFFELNIHPHEVAKVSGIGCSSKLPGYFMSSSFGFNSMHGRMAPIATGVKIANKELIILGVSGDGDTASIGLGGFAHMIRRNNQCIYIVANNGVFGLTKGQFSATSDIESIAKNGNENTNQAIDICGLALELGAGFVARTFVGDQKQMSAILKAAVKYEGCAIIDVISPCITFNNHDGSTMSYKFVKEHDRPIQSVLNFQNQQNNSENNSDPQIQNIELADGSVLSLKPLESEKHDIQDLISAKRILAENKLRSTLLTGLFYLNNRLPEYTVKTEQTEKPLSQLNESELRPSVEVFNKIINVYR